MENKAFKKLFSEIATSNSFESAFGGWFKESSECVFVLDLMKSNFGNYYQINMKIFVNGVFGNRYVKSKDLVKKEIGNICRAEPKEFEAALNLEIDMNEIEREHQLQLLFKKFLVPFSENALTKIGIKILEKKGEIYLLPAVKEELEKLGITALEK